MLSRQMSRALRLNKAAFTQASTSKYLPFTSRMQAFSTNNKEEEIRPEYKEMIEDFDKMIV